MSKPRRGTEQVFYDTFTEWDVDEQAIVLQMLKELHRQALRAERKNGKSEALTQEQLTLKEPASDRCPECGHLKGSHSHECKYVPS